MYIALLDKDIQQVDAKKYREHLTILRRQTQIVEHRVRSFINYTKTLDTGIAKQLFGKSPWQRGTDRVDLPELVREVVREISSFAQVNKLDFNVSVRTPQGRPFPVVIGAYEELKDVVVNLAHNAIKYSLDGSRVNINLTVERNFAVMTMENIGVPIPLADRERIFEFSYRTAEARALRTAGTGIGLAITRSIVENHGGMIQLKGSEFWDRREGRNYNRNTFEVRLPL
jgi:signal transduction histidine kinase